MAEKLEDDYKNFVAIIEREASEGVAKIRDDLETLRLQAAKMGEAAESSS